jgi:hypothetical protein
MFYVITADNTNIHYCKPEDRLQRQCDNDTGLVCAYPFARYCYVVNCAVKYSNICEACLNPHIESYMKGDCLISAYHITNLNTNISPNPSTNPNTYNIPNRYVGMRRRHVQPEDPGPYVGGVPNPFPDG